MQYAYATNMEINDSPESPRRARRRARLILLVEEVGGPALMQRESGTPKSHISAMTSGSRGLGDDLAAKFEKLYLKPPGWFDLPLDALDDQQPEDLDDHPDLIGIRTVKIRLSAGISGFSIEADESDGLPIFFRAEWLQKKGYQARHLVALKVQGASMEPTLHQNDLVVINTADTQPKDGIAFALNYEGEAMIKRMVRDSGAWYLSSDNLDQRKYARKECAEGSCIVIGRVIYKQSEEI